MVSTAASGVCSSATASAVGSASATVSSSTSSTIGAFFAANAAALSCFFLDSAAKAAFLASSFAEVRLSILPSI